MARKPDRADSQAALAHPEDRRGAARRARAEIAFDEQGVLGTLFGEFDANLVQIENRLGVYIGARGNKIIVEGPTDDVACARDVLKAMHERLLTGQELDSGAIESLIVMCGEPTLEGIITGEAKQPPIMIRTRRKTIAPRTAMQAEYMRQLASKDIIFALGPAGTGKTYLAVAVAVAMLTRGTVDRIVLSRPAVEAGERLGFLPGDLREKVDPYLRPLYDALYDMMPAEQVVKRMSSGDIEIAPLAFMRGRTLAHSFVILDEAQNTSAMQMKMFLTRLGENSRMAVTGDLTQIDLPTGQKSGLKDALEAVEQVKGVGVTRFTEVDVVRHPLVAKIVSAYDARDRKGAKKPGDGASATPPQNAAR
jgi:phosphate starvation-inducible PhoH-like protein